uniref:Repulsive guidance molecule C-terminal domain-containing protein n=1 Tax=Panagrolaimus sp. JU765 TaxID=591449 RepID=A0AC34QC27_9BILA
MCLHGCGSNSSLPMLDILAFPEKYIQNCSPFYSPLIMPKLAEEQCRQIDVMDEFFDVCVFDQMTSDIKLSNLTKMAQDDVQNLLNQRFIKTTRQTLLTRRREVDFKCENVEKSSSFQNKNGLILIFLIFVQKFCF